MKKILVVDCNAKMGGIQKALISFLRHECEDNEVSVLLFYASGALLNEIPSNVKIYSTSSDFKYMGMTQADCARLTDRVKRGFYAAVSRFFGQKTAVAIASRTIRDRIPGWFDETISFSHMADEHSFYGGTAQYVLTVKQTGKRICYIHCDYQHSGNRSAYSDDIYRRFDEIVCVSESTKNVFISALPELKDRVTAKYNYIDGDEIRSLADQEPFNYDPAYINAVVVARMTVEKGIDRLIRIVGDLNNSNRMRLYIIGDGRERDNIEQLIREKNCEDRVFLMGEKNNPYAFMRNADLMIVPSYHEAAPVIFQEAIELKLPVLTTRTTSAEEMIGTRYGMVVDNENDALRKGIETVINNPGILINRFQG